MSWNPILYWMCLVDTFTSSFITSFLLLTFSACVCVFAFNISFVGFPHFFQFPFVTKLYLEMTGHSFQYFLFIDMSNSIFFLIYLFFCERKCIKRQVNRLDKKTSNFLVAKKRSTQLFLFVLFKLIYKRNSIFERAN